jgi:hypothetical protein
MSLSAFGEIFNGLLRENAGHNSIGPAVKITGHVLQRFPFTHRTNLRHGIAAELFDGQFKRKPRP